jgi:hypothetical protein
MDHDLIERGAHARHDHRHRQADDRQNDHHFEQRIAGLCALRQGLGHGLSLEIGQALKPT